MTTITRTVRRFSEVSDAERRAFVAAAEEAEARGTATEGQLALACQFFDELEAAEATRQEAALAKAIAAEEAAEAQKATAELVARGRRALDALAATLAARAEARMAELVARGREALGKLNAQLARQRDPGGVARAHERARRARTGGAFGRNPYGQGKR